MKTVNLRSFSIKYITANIKQIMEFKCNVEDLFESQAPRRRLDNFGANYINFAYI